jgi:glycerol-3-phosphate dehydrogenase
MRNLATSSPLLLRPEWRRLLEEHHDVLVVGGGIHGAGVARDATLRGLRVALIERDDWASGTSSRSSKLMHGGLRYLRQGSLRLVREALTERERHLQLAPHMFQRVRFRVAPPSPGAPRRWQIRAGIALYGLLSARLNGSRFWDHEPSYEDAVVDDARFCLEVALDARRHGALALPYVEWLRWVRRGDRVLGARVRDRFTGEEGTVSASAFVNAAGPWADLLALPRGRRVSPLVRLTRGSHVILDRQADDDARLFFSPADGRALFLLPYSGQTCLLTTTDLDEPAPVKEPVPYAEEIRYLRDAFRAQFPEWKHWKPVGLQCGLRPLVAAQGTPSDLSREERILVDPSGSLVSILGGKYTTYRAVAERATDRVERVLGRVPRVRPTRDHPFTVREGPADVSTRIRRAFAEEDAVRLEDVFLRRTSLGHRGLVDGGLLRLAANLWRLRWGKSEAEAEAECQAFRDLQDRRLASLAAWNT